MKNTKQKLDPLSLSKHLFWDVDKTKLDADEGKAYIIHRVLEYGMMDDFMAIYRYYGIDTIAEVATNVRSLDPKSESFISVLSGIPVENFRSYKMRKILPKHWHF